MLLDKTLQSIEQIIKKYRVYLVGGYIRNYLINKETSLDKDLVCIEGANQLAEEIKEHLKGTLIELDSINQIYRVVLADKNYFDIAQAVNKDIVQDAKRRDFTINSVFYDLNEKEFFDPLDGIKDIKNKTIRTYSLDNMIDDPLRFLRLFRFFSTFGYTIDSKLIEFSKENFYLIKNCAKERINQEIIEIFKGDFLVETLLLMYELGVLEIIFPFIKEIKRVPPNSHHHLDLVHHSIETVNNIRIKDPLLKIAALYHDIGKPSTWTIEPKGRHRFIGHDLEGAKIAKEELLNLKFSNKQVSFICDMIKFHIYPATLVNCEDKKKAFARFTRKLGQNTPLVVELSRADRLSARGEAVSEDMVNRALNHLEELLDYYNKVQLEVKNPKSLLNGREIMEITNLKPSKKVGIIIEALIEAQLLGEVRTKQEAIDFIKTRFLN